MAASKRVNTSVGVVFQSFFFPPQEARSTGRRVNNTCCSSRLSLRRLGSVLYEGSVGGRQCRQGTSRASCGKLRLQENDREKNEIKDKKVQRKQVI